MDVVTKLVRGTGKADWEGEGVCRGIWVEKRCPKNLRKSIPAKKASRRPREYAGGKGGTIEKI